MLPRVNVNETDLAARVPNSQGAYAGIILPLRRGPIDKPFLISSQSLFLKKATPNNKIDIGDSLGLFSAMSYLEKGDKLWVRRAVPADIEYATLYVTLTGLRVPETGDTSPEATFEGTDLFMLRGADPGAWNADISVTLFRDHDLVEADLANTDIVEGHVVVTSHDFTTGEAVALSVEGGDFPDGGMVGTRTFWVSSNTTATDIYFSTSLQNAIDGVDISMTSTGSGTLKIRAVRSIDEPSEAKAFGIDVYYKGSLVETHIVSRLEDQLDGYNRNLNIETVLERSDYIRAENSPLNEGSTPVSSLVAKALSPASDGSTVSDADMMSAAGIFSAKETYPLLLLMDGGWATAGFQRTLVDLAEGRGDCVALLSHDANADTATEVVEYRQVESNLNTSWGAMFSSQAEITDRFNNRTVIVPPDGAVAANYAWSNEVNEPWDPVAGYRKGILSVEDVATRYTDAEMEYLYDNGINPILFKEGAGILLWGQKTLQRRSSPLDRLNVRLLLLTITPAIRRTLEENFLFELNDERTRLRVYTLLNAYMDNVKARRGVIGFSVQVDEDNNSETDIENGIMNVTIFIKPTPSVEEINLNMVVTSSTIEFEIPGLN